VRRTIQDAQVDEIDKYQPGAYMLDKKKKGKGGTLQGPKIGVSAKGVLKRANKQANPKSIGIICKMPSACRIANKYNMLQVVLIDGLETVLIMLCTGSVLLFPGSGMYGSPPNQSDSNTCGH